MNQDYMNALNISTTNSRRESREVSRMVDIQTVSIAIASASVVAGVIYYAFQIRHQAKMRQTDFIVRLYSTYGTKEFRDTLVEVMSLQFDRSIYLGQSARVQ
jgi:hypothetical protein